ncbi:MAG TPA: hypothetical protein VHW60_07065 [Caulobacteraceae bacterium]|nr:hypothetical protein [Caulobacteraceae bacterium]
MKTRPTVLLAALALLLAGAADARPVPLALSLGLGKMSCRDWASYRRKPLPPNSGPEEWVLGYLSAYNAFAPGPKDSFHDNDASNVLGWIDTRCAQNPANSISQTLNDFITSLGRPH